MTSGSNGIEDLVRAGFSARVARALHTAGDISLEGLRTLPWGNRRDTSSLSWRIATLPGVGLRGRAEIEAFRAGKNPRSARSAGKVTVSVPMEPGLLAQLDAFIEAQPKPVSRQETIRAFVAAGLLRSGSDR